MSLGELVPVYVHAGSLDLTKATARWMCFTRPWRIRFRSWLKPVLQDFFKKSLYLGRMLLLVDGLDELPPADRPVMC